MMRGVTYRRTLVAVFSALACVGAAADRAYAANCFGNNLLYAISGTSAQISSIDPQNGFATVTLGATTAFASYAAARSPIDGKVYYFSNATPIRMSSYDPATNTVGATLTVTGLNAADTQIVRAGFSVGGTLYMGSDNSTTIYEVNTATGAATALTIGAFTTGTGDITFDPANPNQAYAIASNAGNTFDLYRLTFTPNSTSPTSVTATLIGNDGLTGVAFFGLAFGNNGTLYAIDEPTSKMYAISTSTGAATNVGTTSQAVAGGAYDLATLPQNETTDLSVVKTHTTSPVLPGKPITYSLAVKNNAAATACSPTSLTLTDALPATLSGATYAASTGTYNSTTGLWSGLSLAPGSTITLTITANVANTATASIANTANVASQAGPPGVTDTNTANNTSTDTATVTPRADLAITKTAPATAAVNGLLAYSILISNGGPDAANNATLSDPIPANLAISGTPTCTVGAGGAVCPGTITVSGQNVSATIPTLPSGASLTFNVNVKPSAANSYTNTATVAPPAGTVSTVTATSSATTTVTLTNGFTKTVRNVTLGDAAGNADTGKPGNQLEYALTFTNTTGTTLTNFVVKDPVPASTTFVSAACVTPLPAGVTACSASNVAGVATYSYTGSLANGGVASFLLDVKIN